MELLKLQLVKSDKDLKVEKIIELFEQGKSQKDIALSLGIAYQSVQQFLKRNNIELDFTSARYLAIKNKKINHTFFNIIDSEIKAYLLGFFYADGYIDFKHNRIQICIAEQDRYIIDLYLSYLYPECFIKEIHNTKGALNRQKQLVIRINSKELVDAFIQQGITDKKSSINFNIPLIEECYKIHFIRGYFDGDGCISYHGTDKQYKRISFCNQTMQILKDIQDYFLNEGIKSSLNTTKNYFTLEFNGQKADKVGEIMYKDSNYKLLRKFNKFYKVNTELTSLITKGNEVV